MNDRNRQNVILYVAVGAILLAAIIFFLVLVFKGSGGGTDRGGQGGRDGQPTRPGGEPRGVITVPAIPTVTPTGSEDPGNRPSGGDNDQNRKPSGGNGDESNPTPSGGNGDGSHPTPSGGNGDGSNPTPSGGNHDGGVTPTQDPNADKVTGTPTPTPRIGGPTPTRVPGGGGGDRPTPTMSWVDPEDRGGIDSNALKIEEQWDGGFDGHPNMGDDRWENYLSDLFVRISPDYSVDALNVLDMEGQELFMRMSGMFEKNAVTRQELDRLSQEKWDSIVKEIHTARYRWQLEEIMIKYLVEKADYKQTYWTSYEQIANGIYASDEAHKIALQKASCYHIIADLQAEMGSRGLGYSWNEALATVLRDSGDPMAEVVKAADDVELFMKLGNFFNGSDFDNLRYEQKQLWWQIEAEIAEASTTDRLEELIAKYKLGTESARESFEASLAGYGTSALRRNAFRSSNYYNVVRTCQSSFRATDDFKTWDEALASILKGRVAEISGNVGSGTRIEEMQYIDATPTPTPRSTSTTPLGR
ncbi:MAG: hypothetical protein K6B69_03195 [Lachnospiraceae bacterium]|nr:hypothetical protein [Lachnospiraceae bacterium]